MPRRQLVRAAGFLLPSFRERPHCALAQPGKVPHAQGIKEFISQGNALELAVAVIIGSAFKPIVDAITKVILDIIGQVVGQPNFDSIGQFKIFESSTDYIQPGTILTAVVNFFLIAIAVYFCIVMPMNKLRERMSKEEEDKPAEPTDVELLTEIRDLLANKPQA